jgi:glucose-1-phosphate adenylyltransferase
VIGLRSRIAEGATLDSAYMMGADYYQTLEEMAQDITTDYPRIGVGANTIIKRAIIDKNARIGSGVKLVNETNALEADGPDGSYFIRDGIIIVPKNAVIKNGTVV